jgi:hypothetical protein
MLAQQDLIIISRVPERAVFKAWYNCYDYGCTQTP